jgi:FAD/FMN-containing dehydrogenase
MDPRREVTGPRRSFVRLPAVTVVLFDNSLVSRSGVEELSAELDGSLLDRPAFAPFNLAFPLRPEAVVAAADASDVAATVGWASRRRLRVAVMATGHGLNAAVDDGVLITTDRMDGVRVDPGARTATVQAGATWAKVIEATAPYGLAPINGSSSGVGAVGYTLGGGNGPLSRAYGFSADHVRHATLVDGTGALRDVDAASDPDLFWALRGGKGNFGVVTEMEIDLMPVATLYAGSVIYPGAAASDVLRAFAEWSSDLPDRVSTTSIALLRLPPEPHLPEPIRGQFVVQVRYAHLDGVSAGTDQFAPMRAVAPVLMDSVGEIPYAAVDSIHQDPTEPVPFAEGGASMSGLPPDAVDAILAVAGADRDARIPLVELRRLGGAMSRPAAIPNAVSGRGAAYALSTIGLMAGDGAADVPGVIDRIVSSVDPWRNGQDLFNAIGPATPARIAALWSPSDRARLVDIKRRVDPHGLFGGAHTIS